MNVVGAAERKHLHITGAGPGSGYMEVKQRQLASPGNLRCYCDALNIIKMLAIKSTIGMRYETGLSCVQSSFTVRKPPWNPYLCHSL